MTNYKISQMAVDMIKKFEGFRADAYKCPAGVWTIGFGTTKNVKAGMKVTKEQAEELLRKDLVIFENYVNKLGVCKTQHQFDALVDFAYNCGCGSLGASTLLKYIKEGKKKADIQAQFRRWNKGGGKVLPGLVKRREYEAELFFI